MIVGTTSVLVVRVGMRMIVVVGSRVFGVIRTVVVRVCVFATGTRVLVVIPRMVVRQSDVAGFLAHWVLHDQALRFEEAGATTAGRTWKA